MFHLKSARRSSTFLLFVLLMIAFCAVPMFAQNAHVDVRLNPTYGTVAPPNDTFPPNPQHVFISTMGMLITGVIFLIVSLVEAVKTKSTVPPALIIAAAFCVVPECVDNYLGGCYWSQDHNPAHILYYFMGREFDYYVIAMWWAFGAGLGYVLWVVIKAGARTKFLWVAFGISGLLDVICEEILLNYGGIYTYYGHQPLVLLTKFPWWWLPTNVGALFLSVALAYRFRDWFNGWRSCLLFILMPICYIGLFSFAAMPTMFVIMGNFSPLVTQLGGITTVILALLGACGTMNLVLNRNPFDMNGLPMDAQEEEQVVRSRKAPAAVQHA